MLIVMPYWQGDFDRVEQLARLMRVWETEPVIDQAWILLANRQDCPANKAAAKILSERFRVIEFKCKSPLRGYPGGSNGIFSSVWSHINIAFRNKIDFMFFLEPDAFPTRRDWRKSLMQAWIDRRPGSVIVGDMFSSDGSESGMHINGVAMYGMETFNVIPGLGVADQLAWDWVHRRKIVKNGDKTSEIQYMHAKRDFKEEDLPIRAPAIIHGVKDDSLWKILMKRAGVTV